MNETSPEPKVEEPLAPPPLPQPSTRNRTLTFVVPHVLKSITRDDNGFTHRDVREGGPRQIEFQIVTEYSETEVNESDQVFAVRATNQLNFAGSVINVINDEIELPDFRLVPTNPTATDYLSKVGQKIMVAFLCRKEQSLSVMKRDVFRIDRTFIVLP